MFCLSHGVEQIVGRFQVSESYNYRMSVTWLTHNCLSVIFAQIRQIQASALCEQL